MQIIKAWVDSSGLSHERVHDVAASDGRLQRAGPGALAAVGNSVDVANASYDDSIGATGFTTTWRDPDYDASQEALYYARVIEIPTPRHTTYAAKTMGVEPPEPTTIQERAVTSAIWVKPSR